MKKMLGTTALNPGWGHWAAEKSEEKERTYPNHN